MLDKEGYINSWNEGAQRIKGYTADEIIGKHFSVFYTEKDKADRKPEMELVVAKQTGKFEEEGWRVKKDGSLFWANIIITAAYDDENNHIGFSKITRDLTEPKQVEEALKQSNQELLKITEELTETNKQLEIVNDNLREFASIVSHDLKEPLRKITTFTGMILMKEKETMSESSLTMMNKISNASSRMNVMIDDILSFANLSQNQQFDHVDLEASLQDVLDLLEQTIKDKNAHITTDHLPTAYVIGSQFRQLFQNLISNALKFSREGVDPEINITHQFADASEVATHHLNPANQYLRIVVQDNGIGFSDEDADFIFGLFKRVHGRHKYEGSGLGLGICKKVVENHGGEIIAHAEEGKGATFTILLPYTP
jgi:PAS domain S-box-containing protein